VGGGRLLSTTERKFNILGIQQIAIGNVSKEPLTNFWSTLLGIKKTGSYRSEKENVDEDILVAGLGTISPVEIDLMQPIDPEKAPKVHIPSLNHVGLWVDNLPACVADLTEKGVKFAPVRVLILFHVVPLYQSLTHPPIRRNGSYYRVVSAREPLDTMFALFIRNLLLASWWSSSRRLNTLSRQPRASKPVNCRGRPIQYHRYS
jgi:lactoylglutathione lyase